MDTESGGSPGDRPREKLGRSGAAALGDNELLAIVIGHGTVGRPALELATALLRDVGGVHGLTRVSPDRLRRLPGVGDAKASRVLAAIELGRRTLTVAPRARLPLRTPEAIGDFLVPQFGAAPTERFGVVLLDARLRLIRVHQVSAGGLDAVVAVPRDVFREATTTGAFGVVVFHNHPSGDPTPTPSDVALTRRLVDAGRIVGIEVLDHMILADTVYYSMRKAGRL